MAAQGYVFAPPLPAASFLKLLDAMGPIADVPARPRAGSRAAAAAKSAAG
jgi:hypothetical protein